MLNGVLSSHNSKDIMAGLTKPATHDIVFIRQESKVQKIEPDDEHDPFLKKSGDDETDVGTTKKHRPPKLMTITNGDNDIEKENDVNTAKELKVNGNVVIYMPPKDGHCHEMIKYRNEDGLETPISFDDGPNFPKTKSNQKCYCYGKRFSKSQTCINIVLALVCTTGVVLGVLSFVKTSGESDKNANFYCYPCEATKSVQEKVKKNGMCCLSDPMKEYKETKFPPSTEISHAGYNGSRIVELKADFHTNWTDGSISWVPSESTRSSSFISHHPGTGPITFTHKANYVITLSLTTDTYTDVNTNRIQVIVCLVFKTFDGIKTEECRPIVHTKAMLIPFQVVKYSEVDNGTMITATITNHKALKFNGDNNKLMVVML